jgi:hypothetical protein
MRSLLFLWIIIVLVAVVFVMVAEQVVTKSPTAGNYSVQGSPENVTQGLIVGSISQAPNWLLPGMFVTMAIVLIGVFGLIGRRR